MTDRRYTTYGEDGFLEMHLPPRELTGRQLLTYSSLFAAAFALTALAAWKVGRIDAAANVEPAPRAELAPKASESLSGSTYFFEAPNSFDEHCSLGAVVTEERIDYVCIEPGHSSWVDPGATVEF